MLKHVLVKLDFKKNVLPHITSKVQLGSEAVVSWAYQASVRSLMNCRNNRESGV